MTFRIVFASILTLCGCATAFAQETPESVAQDPRGRAFARFCADDVFSRLAGKDAAKDVVTLGQFTKLYAGKGISEKQVRKRFHTVTRIDSVTREQFKKLYAKRVRSSEAPPRFGSTSQLDCAVVFPEDDEVVDAGTGAGATISVVVTPYSEPNDGPDSMDYYYERAYFAKSYISIPSGLPFTNGPFTSSSHTTLIAGADALDNFLSADLQGEVLVQGPKRFYSDFASAARYVVIWEARKRYDLSTYDYDYVPFTTGGPLFRSGTVEYYEHEGDY